MKKILILLLILTTFNLNFVAASAKTIDMGEFKITAYCPCDECSEGWGWQTASQKPARSDHTIAIDTDVIDMGSKVKIGDKYYIAEDIGGAVNGDHIDIFFDTHEEVKEFGVKRKQVWVIK